MAQQHPSIRQRAKKRILITGGAGYIGSACARALCDAGHHVIVFDNLSTGQRDKVDTRAAFVEGDLRDTAVLDAVLETHTPEVVIHASASKSVEESEQNPGIYFDNNVRGTLCLLDALARHHVPHLIFSSSAAVYAPGDSGVYTEDDPLGPTSVYGSSKMLAEILIQEYARTRKLAHHTIFRYFNVAGDSGIGFRERHARNLFPLIAHAIARGEPVRVFGNDYPTHDGSAVRDYIHVTDLVHAHLCAIERDVSGIFNLGTGVGMSVFEVRKAFEDVRGHPVPYTVEARRAGDAARAVADATRAREHLGWTPRHTIHDMVASTLDVYCAT